MNLTQKLKGWLTENCGVSATASDDEFKKAFAEVALTDKLSGAKAVELTASDEPDPEDMLGKAVTKIMAPFMEKIAGALGSPLDSALANAGRDGSAVETSAQKATRLFGAADTDSQTRVRVKSPIEQYSSTKGAFTYPEKTYAGTRHPFAGRPVMHKLFDKGVDFPLESQSQADMAVIGAWTKYMVASNPRNKEAVRFSEHDKQLCDYAMRELPWSGVIQTRGGGALGTDDGAMEVRGRKLSDFEVKILLDDSTSGGVEAVPLIFDAAIITTPVLFGELFPLVNVVPIARGRRIQGSSISNPTFTSGATEGTAITPFTTDAMIAAFSNTVYPAALAIEIGNDFQEDSPINIASILVEKAGQKAMEWLDRVIAVGNGTTEPLGVASTVGISSPAGVPAGGGGAVPQIADYEKMLFGIAKQYRPASDKDRCVYIANDTTYQRARSVAVGAGDARRVFGMDESGYTILGQPYKVQNNIANTQAMFANLRYYRLYRRLGLNVRTETGGYQLATRNTTLIVVRMRWAGKMELAAAADYVSTMQA